MKIGIIIVSDTRTKITDKSGNYLVKKLSSLQHEIFDKVIVKDELAEIQTAYENMDKSTDLDVIILSGGTGIAKRDTTIEAIAPKLTKTFPGFGEYFRQISIEDIGLKAILTRAIAGVTVHNKACYVLPGSLNACQTGLEKIILPSLEHTIAEIKK